MLVPRLSQEKSPPSIAPILNIAEKYNPILLTKDISTIQMWLNEGADMHLDILPVMIDIIKRKQGISSFSYFSNSIRAAKEKRLYEATRKPEEKQKHPAGILRPHLCLEALQRA